MKSIQLKSGQGPVFYSNYEDASCFRCFTTPGEAGSLLSLWLPKSEYQEVAPRYENITHYLRMSADERVLHDIYAAVAKPDGAAACDPDYKFKLFVVANFQYIHLLKKIVP